MSPGCGITRADLELWGCNLLFLCPQTSHYTSNVTCFYLLDGKDEHCFLKIMGIYSWIYFVSHKVPQSFTCCSLQASLFPVPFASPPPLRFLFIFLELCSNITTSWKPSRTAQVWSWAPFLWSSFRTKGRHGSEFWSLWSLGSRSHSATFYMCDLGQVSKTVWVQSYVLILSYLHFVRIRDRT